MAEEIAIIGGGGGGGGGGGHDRNLKPTAATRTSQCAQHEDSGGGSLSATPLKAVPVPNKRSSSSHQTNKDAELANKSKNRANAKLSASLKCGSEPEDGFLSSSPDSAHGEPTTATATATATTANQPPSVCGCCSPKNCVTLKDILDSFKAPLSEEQAWALIYQSVKLYHEAATAAGEPETAGRVFSDLEIPDSLSNLSVHRDGSVHCSWSEAETKEKQQQVREEQMRRRQAYNGSDIDEHLDERGDDSHALVVASQRKVLRKLGVIVYTALDYNLQADEQCQMSQELEELITCMTAEENDDDCEDEGIDEGYKRWDDDSDDFKCKELEYVLEVCKNHVKPTVPEDHYKAVCRALVTETIELRIFLQHVLNDDTDNLRIKADSETSKQELAKLGFTDWARFWVQVIEELRRGVRLKKNSYSRAPIEYELTPYEILMEDIRCKKYQLRKVMVNGDIPPRVKKDAHALILEFIRSRPPLKKASERQLPPPIKRTPSPREQLMDSIRQGRTLKHIQPPPQPRLKDRLLPPTTATAASAAATATRQTLDSPKQQQKHEANTAPRSKQRLIKVDFSLLQDDDHFFDDSFDCSASRANAGTSSSSVSVCAQPKMPPYPIGGYMVDATASSASTAAPSAALPAALTTRVLRRTKDAYTEDEVHRFFDNALESYDLATQCESRRASLRRHTIVGCQSNFEETHSMPPSRPESRQSEMNTSVRGEGVGAAATATAAAAATTKPQRNYNSNIQQQHQQLQPQQQLKRSQSPSGSIHSAEGGGGSAGGSSNCSRSSSSVGPWNKSFLDEKTWHERGDDRLSLTLEEIVHIRSVMTKAELEGLPVGVRVKEDVEKRKVCFLCLRTRFSIFGPWGIQCKLCQRTVCSKCYTKMRLPVDSFRNVPLVLISPSLLASPAGSSTPSPSHQARHVHSSSTGNILDETFPKSLIERLLRSESERKTRNTVGSAPSSPKHQRSNMSTPGIVAPSAAGQAGEAINDASSVTTSSASASAAASSNANLSSAGYGSNNNGNKENSQLSSATTSATNKHISVMSRSMEGPRSLPVHSPARPHSNSSTLDRKSKFSRAFTLYSSSGSQGGMEGQKENVRGEIVPVCHDCKGLVMEITRSSKQTRSSARNRALQNLTLDLTPVYK